MDLKHHIGARVKSARLQKGLTQEQLAGQLDKSVETVSNLERGTYMTSLETMLQIGQCLNVPMTHFFEGIGEPRQMSAGRVDQELELRRLAESLTDDKLSLALGLVKTVKSG